MWSKKVKLCIIKSLLTALREQFFITRLSLNAMRLSLYNLNPNKNCAKHSFPINFSSLQPGRETLFNKQQRYIDFFMLADILLPIPAKYKPFYPFKKLCAPYSQRLSFTIFIKWCNSFEVYGSEACLDFSRELGIW